ncbi:MAG: PDZ domain-containing protein [Pseudomonadales bacterium]|jgi:predicted metalloprotease with PDZ domain|nr:PDZ domain-containing protein [Pseudomonadales bacterium]MCP5171304.1 PDZ domain-containing protein [Pseudomonadales bacterium]
MTTQPTLRTSFFLLALMWLSFTQTAFAEAKIGIGLKQGYDTAYISDIDPFGSGAASGLMNGDRIKEINGVADLPGVFRTS